MVKSKRPRISTQPSAIQKPRTPRVHELDALDREILRQLGRDPQASNKFIATLVGSSEIKIANRIKLLVEGKFMKITIQRDMTTLGYDILAIVDVYVEGHHTGKTAASLADIPEILSATVVMGVPQIVLLVMAKSIPHLAEVLEKEVGATAGVARTVTSVSLSMIRFSPGIAAL